VTCAFFALYALSQGQCGSTVEGWCGSLSAVSTTSWRWQGTWAVKVGTRTVAGKWFPAKATRRLPHCGLSWYGPHAFWDLFFFPGNIYSRFDSLFGRQLRGLLASRVIKFGEAVTRFGSTLDVHGETQPVRACTRRARACMQASLRSYPRPILERKGLSPQLSVPLCSIWEPVKVMSLLIRSRHIMVFCSFGLLPDWPFSFFVAVSESVKFDLPPS
jgi:hypothetical protein